MLTFSRLLLVYCALSIHLGRVNSLCYYPNGDLARDDQACDSTKSTSGCCGQGYACLSNGLCSKTSFTKDNIGDKYGRGSCTDRRWGSGCPNYCVDPKIDIMDGGTGLAVCPTAANKFYCMNSQNTTVNCASGKGVYTLGLAFELTTIGFAGTSSSTIGSLQISTRSSITSSTLSTSTTSTSIFPNPTTDSTASATSSPAPSSTSISNPKSVAVGAGVGVGAGIVLLGIIAALIIYIRRRKKAEDNPRGSVRYSHPPSYQPGLPPDQDQRHFSMQKDHDLPIPVAHPNNGRSYEMY